MKRYDPNSIEPKWQKTWDETQVYKADLDSDRPKYIAMSMFNYPSGNLHIGHAMNFTISDVMARYKRQQGYESYHPIGWDAFGLPAENRAIKEGISPQESMRQLIPVYHKAYKALGWSNDWSKEISTHEPEYYRWTQWIFAEMFRQGLAYQDARMQWWCEKCQTVLANEQVLDGKCWRHDDPSDPQVEKKEVKQWFFKITEYADELLEATDALDWSDVVKTAQKNWIGKSVGAEVDFVVDGINETLTVFTTRPDTLFGATFLVVAPEHDLLDQLTTDEQSTAVKQYTKAALKKTEIERQSEGKEKTGVFTGSYAINPINSEKVPIWVADYVLGGYGTGAIMAVPAHDERDNEFAKKFNLDIRTVVVQDFGTKIKGAKKVTGVVVFGYDPRTNKFLSASHDGKTRLVSGGLDDGESYEQAAHRELAEEAGFHKVEQMIPLGGPVYSSYYNPIKKDYRRSLGYNFLAIVDSSKQGAQALEDHEASFGTAWYSYEDLYRGISEYSDSIDHWLEGLRRAKMAVDSLGSETESNVLIYSGDGVLIDSGSFDGTDSSEARDLIIQHLEREGKGRAKTTYKIRDWSVSRQRYWGAPIPIINCASCGPVLVPDEQLPVVLPELDDFAPSGDGRSALARSGDWLRVECPDCGGMAERETDTLDTYICSSWYELRYFDPTNDTKPFDPSVVNKWMPIDFYNGGDHATAHLIYVRFVARFFHKLGMLADPEPFKRFLFNGKVRASDGSAFAKSKGNGIDPLEIINQGYGADALRTYLMFAAPLDIDSRWDPQGVPATHRFLSRLWNLVQEFREASPKSEIRNPNSMAVLRSIHPTIKKVTEDLEAQKYNTAIAALMKCVNELYIEKTHGYGAHDTWQAALEALVALVAPFAPHIADELWQQLGHSGTVQRDSWPTWDENYLVGDTMTLAVQVNGKVRAELHVATDASKESIEEAALAHERIQDFLGNKKPARVIYVPGRLVNIVV